MSDEDRAEPEGPVVISLRPVRLEPMKIISNEPGSYTVVVLENGAEIKLRHQIGAVHRLVYADTGEQAFHPESGKPLYEMDARVEVDIVDAPPTPTKN